MGDGWTWGDEDFTPQTPIDSAVDSIDQTGRSAQAQSNWDNFSKNEEDAWNTFENNMPDVGAWGGAGMPAQGGTSVQNGMPVQDSFNTGFDTQQPVEQFEGDMQAPAPAVKLPKKVIGIILCVVCLVLAIVVMGINSIKVKPKKTDSNKETVQQEQQTQQAVQSTENDSILTMVCIPDSTALNYSGDVLQATGTVTEKLKYVESRQVVYCIKITVAFGGSSENIDFFCNYATFNAVKTGDLVVVKYQQVSDGFISVNEVTK